MGKYQDTFDEAKTNPSDFWLKQAKDVQWSKFPTIGADTTHSPFNTWFADGEINACYNAVDHQVANGRAEQAAIVYDSPVTNSKRTLTYAQLLDEVSRFAGALTALGVSKGDRVLIYMPMVPEAVIAVLACARLGAVHSVVFGGFAAKELAVRIDDSSPKVIVAASCGVEPNRLVEYKPLLDEAIEQASHEVASTVVLQREQCKASMIAGRDHDWESVVKTAEPAECVPVASTDPLYVLYTSGTTGQPKGVIRDTGGCVVSLKWSMNAIYDVQPGDVYWAASDIGWVVGHAYIIYGPLFHGCTSVLYEGKPIGTPDAGAYWRVIEEHKVKTLFTAPTAFRAIKKEDPKGELINKYNLSSFKTLFLAGERCDPDTLLWAQEKLQRPVIDHWWQTELGWPACANCMGLEPLPVKAGSPTVPVPGYFLDVLDDNTGEPAKPGDIGSLVMKLPLPPGTFPNLWNAPDRYKSSYFSRFPGYYETGDAGYIDDDGYAFVMARTDDVINVAGHRLSTGAMEEVLAGHPDVAECAVLGVADELKGQLPLGLVILNSGCERNHDDIADELVKRVREYIGPVAAFKSVAVVARLPKTRSGKILRATMRSIANRVAWKMPATIEDPSVLEEIDQALTALGYSGDTNKT